MLLIYTDLIVKPKTVKRKQITLMYSNQFQMNFNILFSSFFMRSQQVPFAPRHPNIKIVRLLLFSQFPLFLPGFFNGTSEDSSNKPLFPHRPRILTNIQQSLGNRITGTSQVMHMSCIAVQRIAKVSLDNHVCFDVKFRSSEIFIVL